MKLQIVALFLHSVMNNSLINKVGATVRTNITDFIIYKKQKFRAEKTFLLRSLPLKTIYQAYYRTDPQRNTRQGNVFFFFILGEPLTSRQILRAV